MSGGVFTNLYPIIRDIVPSFEKFIIREQLIQAGLTSRQIKRACEEGLLSVFFSDVYIKCELSDDRILQEEKKVRNEKIPQIKNVFSNYITSKKYQEAYIILLEILDIRITKNFDVYYKMYLLLLERILGIDSNEKADINKWDLDITSSIKLIAAAKRSLIYSLLEMIETGKLTLALGILKRIEAIEKRSFNGMKSEDTDKLIKLVNVAIEVETMQWAQSLFGESESIDNNNMVFKDYVINKEKINLVVCGRVRAKRR